MPSWWDRSGDWPEWRPVPSQKNHETAQMHTGSCSEWAPVQHPLQLLSCTNAVRRHPSAGMNMWVVQKCDEMNIVHGKFQCLKCKHALYARTVFNQKTHLIACQTGFSCVTAPLDFLFASLWEASDCRRSSSCVQTHCTCHCRCQLLIATVGTHSLA